MKPTLYMVTEATWRANHRKDLILSRAIRVLYDPDREKRRASGVCLACAYCDGGRLAGQAFTSWSCMICERPQPDWPNTAMPKLCVSCANAYGLCAQCLADDELRPRRKVNIVRRPKRRRAVLSNSEGKP